GPSVNMEMKRNCRLAAVVSTPVPRTDGEHSPACNLKVPRQLHEPSPSLNQVADPSCCALAPRLLRLRDAPRYLGMDKNRFNREVRPCVVVIPIGTQG